MPTKKCACPSPPNTTRWAIRCTPPACSRAARRTIARYGLRAALLARADDEAALGKLYDELKKESSKPDPDRRLLLGQVAEMLERYPEALEWYRSVPGGEAALDRAPARSQRAARTQARTGGLRGVARPAGRCDRRRRHAPRCLSARSRIARQGRAGRRGTRRLCARPGGVSGRSGDPLFARADVGTSRRHPARRSRFPPHPGRRTRQRHRAQRARLHARRSHHALRRSAGTHRSRTRRRARQRRDHRQLRLGALSPRPQGRSAGRIAPRVLAAEGSGNRLAPGRSAVDAWKQGRSAALFRRGEASSIRKIARSSARWRRREHDDARGVDRGGRHRVVGVCRARAARNAACHRRRA